MKKLFGMAPWLAAAALGLLAAAPAAAQTAYPAPGRPVKLIVSQQAGGSSDTIARLWAESAAKALGGKDFYVLFHHVVPNTLASVTVIATFGMAIVIITEASLSFLGLGVPVHIPTWGSMLAEGRSYINRAPWLTIFPGLVLPWA